MGSYDAEIRVSTKVDTSQMQRLQLQIDKAVGNVDALTKKYDELKNKKISTEEYSILEGKISRAKQELESFTEIQKQLAERGIGKSIDRDIAKVYGNIQILKKELSQAVDSRDQDTYLALEDKLNRHKAALEQMLAQSKHSLSDIVSFDLNEKEMEDAKTKVEAIQNEMQKLVDTGKAFTIGNNKEEIAEAANELSRAKSELRMLVTKQDELERKSYKASDGLKKIGSAAKKMFGTITAYTNKFFGGFQKNVKKTSGSLGVFSSRLKGIALSLLVFNWITKGFNSMVAGMKEGFKNLIQYSDDYNKSISSLKSANTQLKNSFATAFAPIIQMVIPYIVQLINYVTAAANAIAQFVAVLTGKSTWIKAIAVQEDYAASLDGTASSAKKAAGALAKFDDLDVLNKSDPGSGGGAGGIKPGDMFEEVPINPNIEKLAKKFKDILSKLFEPLKEAWNRQGKFVMDSWKYALEEVRKLIKDIGRDFLTVWTQEDTIKMFEDILIIIGDIGLIVGHLANGFREAWNEGETGLHILENIRDIIAIIIHNFRLAADETVKWAEQLNFTPLLTAFERFTAGFVQVADFLSGVLADFYTKVLLPLGQWVIEKGLPDLLDIFTRFCYEVDWEKLRTRLAEFWEHLEPFAETIGEGLIIFIDDLSKVLKDFANSEVFEKFLSTLEKWMDDVEPEDVANALELIAGALVTLKLGLLGFGAISALDNTFKIIKSFIGYFMGNGGVAGTITKTASSISTLGKALGFLVSQVAAMGITSLLIDSHLKELGEAAGANSQQVDILAERYEGLGGKVNSTKDFFSVFINAIDGFGFNASNTANQIGVLESVMDNISEGAIYTDKQLKKLQERFQLSSDDIEMLRQSMLDTNEPLRKLADDFGLFDYSAEQLSELNKAMKLIENGTVSCSEAFNEFQKPMWGMSDATLDFLLKLQNSGLTLEEFRDQYFKSVISIKDSNIVLADAGTNMAVSAAENMAKAAAGVSQSMAEIENTVKNADLEASVNISMGGVENNFASGFAGSAAAAQTAMNSMNSKVDSTMSDINSTASQELSNLKNTITESFSDNQWETAFDGMLLGFKTKWAELTAWWNEEAMPGWWEESVVTWFGPEKWYELTEGVIEGFTLLWNEVCVWWSENAMNIWWEEYVSPWFAVEQWMELAQGMVTGISNKWNELVTMWNTNIALWWTSYVIPWFTVEKWNLLGENMKNGIFGGFKGLTNKVIDILNEVIAALENMLSTAIAGINSLVAEISTSPLGEMGSFDFSIGNASFGRIPHLADGAVIRGGNPFMAILGDQRAGQTNIEAPQSAIMEAVEEGMSRAGGYRTGSVEININYDGETFARLAIKDFLAELDRQGYDIDMLGGLT